MKTEIEAVPQIKLSLYKDEASWLIYYLNKKDKNTAVDKEQVDTLTTVLNDAIKLIRGV